MRRDGKKHSQKKSGNATLAGFAAPFCLLGALGAPLPAIGQGLPDPTRPPAGFVDPADPGAANAGVGPAVDPLSPDGGAKLVLQSVLLPQRGKPVAVISGRYVPLGSQLDGWELSAVSEREVVLRQGAARQVLSLTPQVSKTMVIPTAAETPKKPAAAKKAINAKSRKAS